MSADDVFTGGKVGLRIFHPLDTHSSCSLVSSLLCRVPSDQTTDISQVHKNTPSQIFFLCDHVSHPNCHTAPQTAVLTQLKGWGQGFLKLALLLKKCWWHHTLHLPGKRGVGKVATQSAAWQEGEPDVRNQHITKALCIPAPGKLQQRFICILTNKRLQPSCKYHKFPKLIS